MNLRAMSAVLILASLGGMAQGASVLPAVLDIDGPQDGIVSLGPTAQYFGAGVVFRVNTDLFNVAMTLDLTCLLPPCGGEIFLTRHDVIDGINIASLEDGALFSGGGTQSFFGQGLDLVAGVYSLSLAMRSGFGGWWGTTRPSDRGDGRVSYLRDGFLTSFDNGFPPQGHWVENTVYDTALTITAEVPRIAAVPLPSGGALLLAGLLGLAWRRRRT